MDRNKWVNFSILVLFMSWISLFLFYGPFLPKMVYRSSNNYGYAQTVVIVVYYLVVIVFTFLICPANVKKLMDIGLVASLCVSTLMWFWPGTQAFYLGYAVVGAAAAISTVSYSYIYIYGFTPELRLRYISLYLCILYATTFVFGYAATLLGESAAYVSVMLLPVAVLLLNRMFKVEYLVSPGSIPERAFPLRLIAIMGFIIFFAYLNTGIEANIYNVSGSLENTVGINGVQVLTLFTIFRLSLRIKRFFIVYCGFIIKGISYVFFMLIGGNNALTPYFMVVSITMLDLFNFCMIGDIALKYGRDYKVSRTLLVAGVVGAIAGELAGNNLSQAFNMDSTHIAGIALIILLMVMLVMPKLEKHVNTYEKSQGKLIGDSECEEISSEAGMVEKLNCANARLLKGNELTARELEVALLLLERFDYTTIAKMLFISENTVRSHARHIYQKFQISGRKQLAELVGNEYRNTAIEMG